MASWVLKFQQADRPEQPILVHVSQKDNDKSLDLDLLATDGDSAYRAKVRERNLKKYQADNFDGTDEEWKRILQYGLILKSDAKMNESVQDSLEVRCTISGKESKATLSIVFRTRVEDITHKLGSVDLLYSENTDDVDLFGWACQAIEQRDELVKQLQDQTTNSNSTKSQITELEDKLKELTTAKEEHEQQLLAKFSMLLNEKKAYIRRQQAQLADVDAPPIVPDTTSAAKKRKKVLTKTDEDDESDDFETMEVDQNTAAADNEDDSSSSQQTTPRQSPDPSSDEDDNLDAPTKSNSKKSKPRSGASAAADGTSPPRSLPFNGRKNEEVSEAQQTSKTRNQRGITTEKNEVEDDEDTASEDDEL